MPMRLVLDTDVLVAGLRSPSGASAEILRSAMRRELSCLASVPLYFEYEAVLLRAEHLAAAELSATDIVGVLDALSEVIEAVSLHFLWRPQLPDPADELVLETACNGRATHLVTFNVRHFAQAAQRFGVEVVTPGALLLSWRKGDLHG